TEGTQKRLAFLPAQHTDFIFPVLAEEFGFVGVLLIISLFMMFFLAVVRIARQAVDPFATVVAAGIMGMLLTHVIENIGMSVGLLPVTGIPLPFFSYGGSFMMITLISVGLLLRIAWDARYKGYLKG
ncbi:MAG: FtsW/RodA/SpoVE family cell cycle protein, partial [Gemmatimonadota bacterium]|nr:FtsW/RodA/SpoVE family cell cycle protein [Gemmatimonadota bacterium]